MHAQSSSGMQFCNPGACPEAYNCSMTDSKPLFKMQHATGPQAKAFPATAAQGAALQSLCCLLGMKQPQQQPEQHERKEHSWKGDCNVHSRAAPLTEKLQPPGLEPCKTWHPADSRPVTAAFCQSQATVSPPPPPPPPPPPHYPLPVPSNSPPPPKRQAVSLQPLHTIGPAQQLPDAQSAETGSWLCQSQLQHVQLAGPPLQTQPPPLPTSKRPRPTPVECLDSSQNLHKKVSSAASSALFHDALQAAIADRNILPVIFGRDQGSGQMACGSLGVACMTDKVPGTVQGQNSNPREPEPGKHAGPLYTAARYCTNTAAWFADHQVDSTGHNQPPISTELTIGSQQRDSLLQSDGADNNPYQVQCLWQCYPYCAHGMLSTPCTAPIVSNCLAAGSLDGPPAAASTQAVADHGDTDHDAAASIAVAVPHAVSSLTYVALNAQTQAPDNTVGCAAPIQPCSSVTPDVHPLMAFLPDLPPELV